MKKTAYLGFVLSVVAAFGILLTPSTGNAQAVSGLACLTLGSDVSIGAHDATSNDEVTQLQTFLYNQGYLSVAPTGYYGNLTKAAVVIFQTAHGVPGTGYVGPLTRAALHTESCSGSASSASSTPITTTATTSSSGPATISSVASYTNFNNATTFTVTGINFGKNFTYPVLIDGNVAGTGTVSVLNGSSTNLNFIVPTLPDGSHKIAVLTSNGVSTSIPFNTSTNPASQRVMYTITNPTIIAATIQPAILNSLDTTVSPITYSTGGGSTSSSVSDAYIYSSDGGGSIDTTFDTPPTIFVPTVPVVDTTPTIVTPVQTVTTPIISAPSLTSFAPSAGPVGTSFTINGSGFSNNSFGNTIVFDGKALGSPIITNTTAQGVTSVTFTIPEELPGACSGLLIVTNDICDYATPTGTHTIAVSTSAGTSSPLIFNVTTTAVSTTPVPVITAVTPKSVTTGAAMTVSGTNFSTIGANNTILIDGASIGSGAVQSTAGNLTTLSFNLPYTIPSAPCPVGYHCQGLAQVGSHDIAVVTSGATSTPLTFVVTAVVTPAIPIVATHTPTSGPSGTTLVMTGVNFSTSASGNIVLFDGTYGGYATVQTISGTTATKIAYTIPNVLPQATCPVGFHCQLPAAIGSHTIMIQTSNGTSTPFTFDVTQTPTAPILITSSAAPAISSISPTTVTAGTTVTIDGSNLGTGTTGNLILIDGGNGGYATIAATSGGQVTQLTYIIPRTLPTGLCPANYHCQLPSVEGSHTLTVTTSGGTSNGVVFDYQ